MDKNEIIAKIEYIADNANDNQIKLNALSFLLNRIESNEKAIKFERQQKEIDETFNKKLDTFGTLSKIFLN